MEAVLSRFAEPDTDARALFPLLIEVIRPDSPADAATARRNIHALCHLLSDRSDLREAVREKLIALSQSLRHAELYTSTGILPNTGFMTEAFRRIGHKILPEVLDDNLLRTALRLAFHRPDDARWVSDVGEDSWLALLNALRFDERAAMSTLPRSIGEILRSLRILSTWIAALGMEPELIGIDRSLEDYESPFAAQHKELDAYIEAYPTAWRNPEQPDLDDKHLRVLLAQCLEIIEKIRRRAAREGTSIRLTYTLHRLSQMIRRAESLLDIVDPLQREENSAAAQTAMIALFIHLVTEECQRNNLFRHLRNNTEIIALRVTENAGQHGEHYITETRREYFSMARSAAVGGIIIAFMACLKLLLTKAEMPPLTGALAFCLNYGLGFCLIHIVHGTVATKQPAMTANAIAATISQSGGKLREMEGLTALIARTVRSQLVAIPLAGLIAWSLMAGLGEPLAGVEKSEHLLLDQSLIHSGAVFYAAIAGICLFVSGLISGYYDNYAVYNRVPQRILQLDWPRRVFGERRMKRVANYIGDNLGALAGNFIFGFMLGGTTIFGQLFGLPIDIRHVAFSSAFVGISVVGLDFAPDLALIAWALLGVATIGLLNLGVSFSLALNVALRARQVSGKQWRRIAGAVLTHMWKHPRDFFLPPRQIVLEKGKTPD